MRKIPPGAEASNILVGEVDFLDKTLSVFIRLSQAGIMGDLTEVPVPTRFIFVLLGPMVRIAYVIAESFGRNEENEDAIVLRSVDIRGIRQD